MSIPGMLCRTTSSLTLILLLLQSSAPGQWVQTNGPYGGRVYCFAVSRGGSGSTSIFAGNKEGVWLSTNSGTNWTPANAGLMFPVMELTVSPNGTDGMNLFAGSVGVFLSTNNGSNWTAISNGLPNGYFGAIASSPDGKGGTNLVAGTTNGVFLSTNNGESWQDIRKNLPPWEPGAMADVACLAVCLDDTGGTIVLAGIPEYGAFRISTNAAYWSGLRGSGLTSKNITSFAISPNGAVVSDLFACTTDSGVFRSTNAGATWTAANSGLTDGHVRAFAVKTGSTGGTCFFAATAGGLFRSSNKGASWEAVNTNLACNEVSALAVSSNGANDSYLFAGTEARGVFLSTDDGASWTAANTGLIGTDVEALAFSSAGGDGMNLFAGTLGDGVSRSTDGGTHWAGLNAGLSDPDVVALAVSQERAGGANLFAGTYGGLFRSTDNGETWMGPNPELNNTAVAAFAVSDTNVLAGCDGGVFRSTNGGASWTNIGLTATFITALAVGPTGIDGTTFFAGSQGGGVFRSTNSGTSWTAVNTGLPNRCVNALAIGPNPTGGRSLFACANYMVYPDPWPRPHQGGIFVSTDDGASWTTIDSGLTNTNVHALAVSANGTDGTVLFAGTANGVYLLTYTGQEWIASHTGLANRAVKALMVCGEYLYTGIHGSGVWCRPLSEMITTVEGERGILSAGFSLEQNYPNPFNPGTTIRYSLPSRSHVTLTVFNMLGQEVALLQNGEQEAGYHEVKFDGSGLSSGVYFYRMQAGDFVQTRRLLLLR